MMFSSSSTEGKETRPVLPILSFGMPDTDVWLLVVSVGWFGCFCFAVFGLVPSSAWSDDQHHIPFLCFVS